MTVSLPFVLINGEPAGSDVRTISARDRGLTLADGLFETMLVRNGRVFRRSQHLTRLADGLRRLAIPEPREIDDWITEALLLSGGLDASIRLTVTRGPGPGGLPPPPRAHPTVIVAINPMPRFPASLYEKGLRAIVASGRRNQRSITAGLKTLAYTDSVAAWIEAQQAGADEAIFLDTDDHCSEATAGNLFACENDVLLTPPIACAALPGITRATIVEAAATFGITVREEPIALDQLRAASEVFITSSLRGIAPLTSLDGRPIGTGMPGRVTRRLSTAYAAIVDEECAATRNPA
ncbi:MAG TPA: aminotransferase class IV [Vicinamibacterales bacterium]|jgi:branched-chain amino acid aminotransferase|nr:aminotransferase class IV [Vicinamibacterales bacterium]